MPETCATCPFFRPIEGDRGWCEIFDRKARESHLMADRCQHEIDRCQKQEIAANEPSEDDADYVMALEQKLIDSEAKASQKTIEVDRENGIYRIWNSYHFLGSVYRDLDSDLWTADSIFARPTYYRTRDAAQKSVVRAWVNH